MENLGPDVEKRIDWQHISAHDLIGINKSTIIKNKKDKIVRGLQLETEYTIVISVADIRWE